MRIDRAHSSAPATVANVGPGFDVFGFALDGPCDAVGVRRIARPAVRLVDIRGDGGALPLSTSKNVAAAVAAKMLRAVGATFGIEMTLEKGMPIGSGLGSSSASAVAAVVATDRLLGGRFSENELLDFARYGEKVACGSSHADNVAPALLGGFTIVRSLNPLEIVRLDVPSRWRAAVVHPHFRLDTKRARAALPPRVPLAAMTASAANSAAAVAAIYKKDLVLFGRAVMGDVIVAPARMKLIPAAAAVAAAALRAGAAGVSVSGAGPTLFALTDSEAHAKIIARKMAAFWLQKGLGSDIFISPVGAVGALKRS